MRSDPACTGCARNVNPYRAVRRVASAWVDENGVPDPDSVVYLDTFLCYECWLRLTPEEIKQILDQAGEGLTSEGPAGGDVS